MTSEENMEKKLQELADSIAPDNKLVENVMEQVNQTDIKTAHKPKYNRLVFNRLTRLAAAAAITTTAAISILFGPREAWKRRPPPEATRFPDPVP